MRYIDLDIGEKVELDFGGRVVEVIPQKKSGRRVRLGIEADRSVAISNPISLKEEGLVDVSQ